MTLNKGQKVLIAACMALFFVLYFGCDTTPPAIQESQKRLSNNFEVTGIQNILQSAVKNLNQEQRTIIDFLSKEVDEADVDSIKIKQLMGLSSKWYEFGYPSIAGHYAEQIADKSNTESSWSIAGTTYILCVQLAEDATVRDFCTARAIKALENAISINPNNVDHRINKALVYVENPPNGQPMTGILQLRDLNTQYPDNVAVINQLAKLAIRTNQLEKALERLQQALKLEPENPNTNCLLAEVFTKNGDAANEALYREKCLSLNR